MFKSHLAPQTATLLAVSAEAKDGMDTETELPLSVLVPFEQD